MSWYVTFFLSSMERMLNGAYRFMSWARTFFTIATMCGTRERTVGSGSFVSASGGGVILLPFASRSALYTSMLTAAMTNGRMAVSVHAAASFSVVTSMG